MSERQPVVGSPDPVPLEPDPVSPAIEVEFDKQIPAQSEPEPEH
jgi:hypothetical protein